MACGKATTLEGLKFCTMDLKCLLPNPCGFRDRQLRTGISDDRPFTRKKYQESMYGKVMSPSKNIVDKERRNQDKTELESSSSEGNKV